MLKIAQAAMNEFGGGRRCSRGEVTLFGKENFQAAACRITGNSAAVYPPPITNKS
jgi:hypothetical protein